MKWDREMISRKRKRGSEEHQPSKRFLEPEEDSEDDLEPSSPSLKSHHPFSVLFQELSSDDESDSSFDGNPNALQPTPHNARSSVMRLKTAKPQPSQCHTSAQSPLPEEPADTHEESGNAALDPTGDVDGEGTRSNDNEDDTASDNTNSEEPSDEDYEEESDSTDSRGEHPTNYATWGQYYQEASGDDVMETLLIYFCRHLQDILGGCKKPRHAVWHSQNVRHICYAIDPKADSLARFLQDGGSNIWAKWAKPLLDSKPARPGTIRALLSSLHKFFEFVIDQTENRVTTFPAIDADTIERCKLLVKRVIAMSSAVNQMYSHDNWERVLEDQMNAINPSETSSMVDTPPAKKALALIISSAVSKLTKRDALVVRDFLIARIVLENGQRPGPLETARLRDFERLHEKDGQFVMFVSQHKTSEAGPAPTLRHVSPTSGASLQMKTSKPSSSPRTAPPSFRAPLANMLPNGGKKLRVSTLAALASERCIHQTS